jgi:CRISPR-associated protein Csm3
MATIRLLGRVLITGAIKAVTGMHIGGTPAGLSIGGLDSPVIRDPRTRQPYIPGSSLKGKMRSLSERSRGFDPEREEERQRIGPDVRIHICRDPAQYAECAVCPVFGVPGDLPVSGPTRLSVRDVRLSAASLEGAHTDFPFTEVKWEAAIDRLTSKALPRQIERVPAGAVFRPFEMVLSIYDLGAGAERDFGYLNTVVTAMQLLQDDALGGHGSRGSGQIQFGNIRVAVRRGRTRVPYAEDRKLRFAELLEEQPRIAEWARETLSAG